MHTQAIRHQKTATIIIKDFGGDLISTYIYIKNRTVISTNIIIIYNESPFCWQNVFKDQIPQKQRAFPTPINDRNAFLEE